MFRLVERIGDVGKRRASIFEMVEDRETRIGMLGAEIASGGARFVRSHGRWMEWLRSQGVDHQEAVKKHREWHANEMQNSFWGKSRKTNTKASERRKMT